MQLRPPLDYGTWLVHPETNELARADYAEGQYLRVPVVNRVASAPGFADLGYRWPRMEFVTVPVRLVRWRNEGVTCGARVYCIDDDDLLRAGEAISIFGEPVLQLR